MSTLLKKFSIESEATDSEQTAPKTVDFIQEKYIGSFSEKPAQEIRHHAPISRKKPHPKVDDLKPNLSSRNRKQHLPDNSEITPRSTFLRVLFSPTFSFKNYFIQLPTLLLCLISYYASWLLFHNIQPETVKNIFIPNSFFPIIFLLGCGHFFFSWCISQNFHRSLILSALLSSLLLLRLNQLWHSSWILILLFTGFLIETLLTYRSFRR